MSDFKRTLTGKTRYILLRRWFKPDIFVVELEFIVKGDYTIWEPATWETLCDLYYLRGSHKEKPASELTKAGYL